MGFGAGVAHDIVDIVSREVAFEAHLVDLIRSTADRCLQRVGHAAKTDPALLDCTLTLQHELLLECQVFVHRSGIFRAVYLRVALPNQPVGAYQL